MIVAQQGGRLRLTLQTDHALLAGQLADAWGGPPFARPEPMGAIRLAVDLHDEGWAEVDANPCINPATGRPYDFRDIPQDVHVDAYDRCVRRALAADPYAGLLVSLHGTGLYRRRYGYLPHLPFREVSPACRDVVERYLAAQDQLQAGLVAELKPDPAALWTHYRWLQVWDMISVFACMVAPSQPFTQLLGAIPRFPGGPDGPMTIRTDGEGRFVVDPWPFTVTEIRLRWPARWIADRPYETDDDLRASLAEAAVETQSVALVPA